MFCFCKSLASSYIIIWVDRLSYMFLWERKPSAVSLTMPSASLVWAPMLVRMKVHSLSIQFIMAIGLLLDGLSGSVLLDL